MASVFIIQWLVSSVCWTFGADEKQSSSWRVSLNRRCLSKGDKVELTLRKGQGWNDDFWMLHGDTIFHLGRSSNLQCPCGDSGIQLLKLLKRTCTATPLQYASCVGNAMLGQLCNYLVHYDISVVWLRARHRRKPEEVTPNKVCSLFSMAVTTNTCSVKCRKKDRYPHNPWMTNGFLESLKTCIKKN